MRIKKETLVQAIDELMEENTSAAVGPIATPHAFTGRGKKNKSLSILRKYLTDTERTFKHTKKL